MCKTDPTDESDDRPRCTGYTIEGRRCEGVVVPGLDVCHHHLDQSDDIDTRDEPVGVGLEDDDEDDRPAVERHPIREVLEDQ